MPAAFQIKLSAARTTRSWQLALDKFPFNLERTQSPSLTKPDDKEREQSIKATRLSEIQKSYTGARTDLDHVAKRQQQFLARLAVQYGSRFLRIPLVNASRLLLHLGRSSVLENVGLNCERITGLPVIPGSAVKGVLSTWACWEANENRAEFTASRSALGQILVEVLGSNPTEDAADSHLAGGVCFLGAFPQSAPGMELDIVTPHPDNGRGRITPNPFLSIRADTKWDFVCIAASRLAPDKAMTVLKKTEEWLRQVLTMIGIGAKTASGFGNFRELSSTETKTDDERFGNLIKEILERAAVSTMTDEDRAYHAFAKQVADWAPMARDVMTKPEPDKSHIMRFFKSPDGQAVIKGWPKNDKAKARLAALKEAGL